jgi:hypothetical protein
MKLLENQSSCTGKFQKQYFADVVLHNNPLIQSTSRISMSLPYDHNPE